MSIVCVCIAVKIQFDNTSTCKYSIILTLSSVDICTLACSAPYSKILYPPLAPLTTTLHPLLGVIFIIKPFPLPNTSTQIMFVI